MVAVSLVKLLSRRALSDPIIDTIRYKVVLLMAFTGNAISLVTFVNVSFLILSPALYITVNGPIPAEKLKVSKGVSVSNIGPLPFIDPCGPVNMVVTVCCIFTPPTDPHITALLAEDLSVEV